MGIWKVRITVFFAIMLAAGMMASDASARIEGRWALQTGDITVGEDISIQKPMASVFHQQTTSLSDVEHLNLNFPIFSDGVDLGPTTGAAAADGFALSGGTANVLPFGPVNLALPSLHQDVTEAARASSTGFFTANWAYMADLAASNLGSEPLGATLGSGHPLKSPRMMGSEFLWPLMVPLPKAMASTGEMTFDPGSREGGMPVDYPIGNILDKAPMGQKFKISFDTNGNNLTAANNTTIQANNTAVQNQTSQGGNASNARKPTRKPRVDLKANKTQIKDMTLMQRTWRNAFVGTTMHMAYEGPTHSPTWINPYDNGRGVFNAVDKNKCCGIALNKTRAGEHIAPVFWDL